MCKYSGYLFSRKGGGARLFLLLEEICCDFNNPLFFIVLKLLKKQIPYLYMQYNQKAWTLNRLGFILRRSEILIITNNENGEFHE